MTGIWLRLRTLRAAYTHAVTELDIDMSLVGLALIAFGVARLT